MNFSEIIRQTREHLALLQTMGIDHLPTAPANTQAAAPPQGNQPAMDDRGPSLEELRNKIGDCKRCKLHSGRTNIVFGTGAPRAKLVFVGEAPGGEEDLQGKPFVGKAGQLLTRMIEAMGLKREDVYIANIIKCRPPDNRNPEEDEIQRCEPFLFEQLRIIRPAIVCALGKFAAQTLLKTTVSISKLRGTLCDLSLEETSSENCSFPASGVNSGKKGGGPFHVKIIPTFHPAYLLRNPSAKKIVWEDLQVIMRELGLR